MTTPEVGTAVSILQRSREKEDEAKSLYLSYRACYLSESEARRLAGIATSTIETWREEDPLFYQAEVTHLQEFQELNHKNALSIEYVRNYRLVLEKDMTVLLKSLTDAENMTNSENTYLNKMRGSYTPEGLDRLSRVVQGKDGSDLNDLMQFIREREVRIVERNITNVKTDNVCGRIPGVECIDSPGGNGDSVDSRKG